MSFGHEKLDVYILALHYANLLFKNVISLV
jgi:hypothetical protein